MIKIMIKAQTTMFLIITALIISGNISGTSYLVCGLNLPPVSLNFDDTLANILKPHISCTLTEQFLTAEYLMKVSGTRDTMHTTTMHTPIHTPIHTSINDNSDMRANDNTSNNMDNDNMDNDKDSHLIQLQEEYDKINQLRYEHTTQRTKINKTHTITAIIIF